MICFPFERKRGERISSSKRRFSPIIDDLGLRDFSLQGGTFTWREGRNNSMSRLDRFLFSDDWEDYFTNVL